MRQFLIRLALPLFFCIFPLFAAILVAIAIPVDARIFYLDHVSPMDWLILSLGAGLFGFQLILSWLALRWHLSNFDERPDRWLSSLAQAATRPSCGLCC